MSSFWPCQQKMILPTKTAVPPEGNDLSGAPVQQRRPSFKAPSCLFLGPERLFPAALCPACRRYRVVPCCAKGVLSFCSTFATALNYRIGTFLIARRRFDVFLRH